MVSTGLNLRGNNLRWGVRRLVEKVIPDYQEHAKTLADKVLTHDALSHTLGRYAVAIRPEELMLVLRDFAGFTPAENDQVGKELKSAALKVLEKANQVNSDVLAWFNTIMDRSTERFVLRTRLWTAIFAFGLAFALHIDTLHIVKQLSSKPEVRAAVVNAALKDAVPQYTNMQNVDALPVEAIRALANNNPAQAKILEAATESDTRAQGRAWIVKRFPDATIQKKLLDEYELQFDALGKKRVQDLQADYEKIRGWVEASQLELGPPAEYCTFKGIFDWTCGFNGVTAWHLLGMFVTALFLSLGAPFWFNALRNMSNLRPILAGKVENDKES
jgi:hypothetical protein